MTPSGSELAHRVALVTGGSRGLGREMVLAMAHAGADVVIVSRKFEACAALAEEVRATTGRTALPLACHVGDWDALGDLVSTVYGEFGRIDILVNNAGMSPPYDQLSDVDEALWDKVIAVNLKGVVRLTTLVGARMAAGRGGSIVNISSASSFKPTPDVLPYAAAKAGVNAITVAFAHAFGPTVRVNCIVPGAFFTDVSKHWDIEAFERQAQSFALRRGGQPHEIVGALLYFAGDASSYTTGALLRVDGGFV
jgi:NAD(P)-dependent dehydrogenase (short-subunit alcohol dehydrogenase family)